MAFDAFIQIDSVVGEALDQQHKGWIEVTGFTFGVNQTTSPTASSNGGATSGRSILSDLTFSKHIDAASNKLFELSCAGDHIKKVTLSVNRAGGNKLSYQKIVLEEVIISDFVMIADDGLPFEQIKLNYGRISTTYTQQNRADGSAAGQVSGGWDRTRNSRIA